MLSVRIHAQRASSQPAPTSNLYRIAGVIVNSVTGEPLHHATVAALSEEDSHTIAAVQSDDEGRFALENLPAAKYQLTASRRGYRTAFYDEHDNFSTAIVTGPDQDTGNLTFRLIPGAVLRGTVTTDGGDPVANARVMLFLKSRSGKAAGRINQADTDSTDDTGGWEFNNLAAGDYMLAVSAQPWYAMHRNSMVRAHGSPDSAAGDPPTALDVAYPVTYYDSTTEESDASTITLTGGGRDQADIVMHAVSALHIQVDTPQKPDGSIAGAKLRQTVFGAVVASESQGFFDAARTGVTEFTGVAPGHYVLSQGDPPRMAELDAATSMQVDPTLGTPTVSIRGTVQSAAGAGPIGDCNLVLQPLDGLHGGIEPPMAPAVHGAFTFAAVPPGDWVLLAFKAEARLAITSITAGGRTQPGNLLTVRDRPVSVVVTVGQGSMRVQGFARRNGKGVQGVMVVLVPSGMKGLEVTARRDQSDSDGSFSLRDVPPGVYTLVAIQDGWSLDWAEPEVMARYLPGGIPVTVTDSSGKLLRLTAPAPVQSR